MKTTLQTLVISATLAVAASAFALDADQERACRWSGGNGETPEELAGVFEAPSQSFADTWWYYDFGNDHGVVVTFYRTVSGALAASRIATYGFREPDWWSEECLELRVPSRWED